MSVSRLIARTVLPALLCLAALAFATPAAAAEFPPHTLEPELSLTGDCSIEPGLDEVPDPSCPYQAFPAGPSGRFNEPRSVAIDAYGDEYVASVGEGTGTAGRIDIFNDAGEFISEFADSFGPLAVAVDSKGILYVHESVTGSNLARYIPTVYKPETGEIFYSAASRTVIDSTMSSGLGGVAVDFSNDHVYASWWDNYITEYKSAKEGNGLLHTITPEGLGLNNWVAVDGQRRRLYASSCNKGIFDCVVRVFEADAPYAELAEVDGSETPAGEFLSITGRMSIAVDEQTGHFFIADLAATNNIYEFSEDYKYLSRVKLRSAQANALQIALSNSPLNPTAKNYRYLFTPLTAASGSVLAFKPPAVREPKVEAVSATGIGQTEAQLGARIDPGIDPASEPAEYEIEYVSQAQFEATGFAEATLAGSGTVPSGAPAQQVSAFATGLVPGSAYRFRALAKNGVGDDQQEGAFSTYSDAPIQAICLNEKERAETSAALPDCRAYELVSPPDTNGNPTKGSSPEGDRFGSPQSSASGEAISFFLLGGALPGTEATGGVYGDPYRATRGPTGWSTELSGPTGAQTSQPRSGSFSPDQGFNFWIAAGKEGTALVAGKEAHYLRYPDGHSELVGRGSLGTDPAALGRLITEDGGHVVFQTGEAAQSPAVQLEPDAPPDGIRALYDRTADEVTHVVSLLPGDATPSENATYEGASEDGSGIAFAIGADSEGIGGTLYLRVDDTTTYEIGEGVEFAGVSEGGGRVFYVEDGDLKAFDTAAGSTVDFTPGIADAIPVNVAADGSRAYFVSEEAIAGSGPNPNGAEPAAGGQNLYLSEEGEIGFIATVTNRDVEGVPSPSGQRDGLGLWAEAATAHPGFDPSRLSGDGSVLLFQSRASLGAYDSGGSVQVYRYDATAPSLDCISCPPSGLPATGGAALQSFTLESGAAPFSASGFAPNLRADGRRAFFESTEALVSADADGKRDVYEWEAQGVGSCNRPAGCIYLISPAKSPAVEYLFGQSSSGDDVFFTTERTLVPGDQGTLSVYDARVGGGFTPVEPAGECLGEACLPTVSAPPRRPAASAIFDGPGNAGQPSSRRCPKGRRAVRRGGKARCVAKKPAKKHHRSAGKRGHR